MNRIIFIFLLFLLPWSKVFAQASETEDNYCVEFNGKDDCLDLGENSNLYLTYFTQEIWIYPYFQNTSNDWAGFIGNQLGNTTAQRAPSVWIYLQKKIHYGFGSGQGSEWTSGFNNATTDKNVLTLFAWNHVAITFDGIDYNAYVNGELVYNHTKAASKYKPVKTAIRYFGRIDNYYKGLIDDIRVWSYARTQKEIADNMKELLTGDEPGLIGYWTFNDQKIKAMDKTPRGNNGTLVGSNVRFIKMPLGDDDAMYVIQNPIPIQSVKVDQQKDAVISWTFGHKPNDEYKVTLVDVSDETKARVTITQKNYGDSIGTKMSIKGLKEGMITAKLAFDYGKYHLEHTFLIDVKSAETGKLPNHSDIGINGKGEDVNGASLYSNGVYTLLDNGGVVGSAGNSDGGTYISWDLTGDGDFQARILNEGDITATDVYGLSVREDATNATSKSFGVYTSFKKLLTNSFNNFVLYRAQTAGSNTTQVSTVSTTTLPNWLRINRTANVFTAYTSTNPSATWIPLGSTTIDMKSAVKVGLFSGAGNEDGARKPIKFDNISLTGSLSVINPLSDMRIISAQTVTFDKVFSNAGALIKVGTVPSSGIVDARIDGTNLILTPVSSGIAQVILYAENGTSKVQNTINVEVGTLKEGWQSADIWKTPALASGQSFLNMPSTDKIIINSIVMDKSANDLTNTTVDGITFVAQKKNKAESEMQEITVYVKEIGITGSGVRAGVMFRDGFDNGSVQVGLSCTAFEGLQLEYRWLNNVTIEKRTLSNVKPPCWLKLTNYKGAYNAYYSNLSESAVPVGNQWNCVLGSSLIIQMMSPVNYVGVFSNTNSYREGVANFTNVSVKSYDGSKIACTRTDVVENTDLNPSKVKSYPNPFNGTTKVEFANLKKGKVDVRLYNASGVELSVLYSGIANTGLQTYTVDLTAMPAGMYYCKVITTSGVEVVKLMQIK